MDNQQVLTDNIIKIFSYINNSSRLAINYLQEKSSMADICYWRNEIVNELKNLDKCIEMYSNKNYKRKL